MCSGYGNGSLVIIHKLAQKLRAGEHRDIFVCGSLKFRIVRVDRSSIYNDVNIVCDIGCALRVCNGGTKPGKPRCKFSFVRVGAAYRKAAF